MRDKITICNEVVYLASDLMESKRTETAIIIELLEETILRWLVEVYEAATGATPDAPSSVEVTR